MYRFALLFALLALFPAAAQLAEPWQSPYTGDDAQGDDVIAFWNFEGEGETVTDVSGKGHDGKLAGAVRNAEGRFGAGATSFRGYPVEDVRHAIHVSPHADLSPQGAFTLELWVRPSPELADYGAAHLIDKKYVAHSDYQWKLEAPDGLGHRRMRLTLGFGDDSEVWFSSEGAPFEAGVWYHLAVTYDGAGTVAPWAVPPSRVAAPCIRAPMCFPSGIGWAATTVASPATSMKSASPKEGASSAP